jgi:ArsR family transcriptional regulator
VKVYPVKSAENGSRPPANPDRMVDDAEATMAALRFLSDANRLRILTCLAQREMYVTELTEQLGLPQPLVSYHLRRLREAGLVCSHRRARRVYYAIDPAGWHAFTRPIKAICEIVESVSDEAASTAAGTPRGHAADGPR